MQLTSCKKIFLLQFPRWYPKDMLQIVSTKQRPLKRRVDTKFAMKKSRLKKCENVYKIKMNYN